MNSRHSIGKQCPAVSARTALAVGTLVLWAGAVPAGLHAQEKPKMIVEEDCAVFSVAADNKIACSVQHFKRMKKFAMERDDIWVADPSGRTKRIVEGAKFMPVPPPATYIVDALRWSPDSRHLAADITLQQATSEDDTAAPVPHRVVALLSDDGQEIRVAGSKTRFIEDAANGAWLADGETAVYLTGGGPYNIVRVRPAEGKTTTLFEGHTFDAVVWDANRNRAFAVGRNLSVLGREALVELDLLHETVTEVGRVDSAASKLTVSPSGKKVAYFVDGETIEIRDISSSPKPLRVRVGVGRFEWAPDEKRIFLKRGLEDKSGSIVWISIPEGNFHRTLHDLMFHDFRITPDGESIIVAEPGKKILKVYPLP
jgi:hypothetical protein